MYILQIVPCLVVVLVAEAEVEEEVVLVVLVVAIWSCLSVLQLLQPFRRTDSSPHTHTFFGMCPPALACNFVLRLLIFSQQQFHHGTTCYGYTCRMQTCMPLD
jgi:hypothetical protein